MDGQYKIAVIGAGVNGLYIAWKLSLAGHKVVVYEKKSNPFGKACSGLISARLKDFMPLENGVILNSIKKCFINYPRKRVELEMYPVHYVIDRDKLNKWLWEAGKKAGAEYIFNKEIMELPEKDFDRVILCNGALSKLEENPDRVLGSFYLGLQFFEAKKDNSDYVETWAHETGFFWKVPRGENTEWGVLGQARGLQDKLRAFCQDHAIIFPEEKIQAAIIPQGLRIVGKGKIASCGDAAGLCKPWSGGGVVWGLTAADMLIKNIDNLEKYEKEANNFFAALVIKGEIAKKMASFAGFNMPFLLPSKVRRDNDFPLF